MKRLLLPLIIFGVSTAAISAEKAATSLEPLQSAEHQNAVKIQQDIKAMQVQQQKQIATLNTQIQEQLKKVQTDLQAQITNLNDHTQKQMKEMQINLQQQIAQVQQQIKH